MAEQTQQTDGSDSTVPWDSLERSRSMAFLAAGGLALGFVVSNAVEAFTAAQPPTWVNALFVSPALVAAAVGLLGGYPLLADRVPRLALAGAIVVTVAGTAATVLFAVTTANALFAGVQVPFLPVYLLTLLTTILGFVLFGAASLWTSTPSSSIGVVRASRGQRHDDRHGPHEPTPVVDVPHQCAVDREHPRHRIRAPDRGGSDRSHDVHRRDRVAALRRRWWTRLFEPSFGRLAPMATSTEAISPTASPNWLATAIVRRRLLGGCATASMSPTSGSTSSPKSSGGGSGDRPGRTAERRVRPTHVRRARQRSRAPTRSGWHLRFRSVVGTVTRTGPDGYQFSRFRSNRSRRRWNSASSISPRAYRRWRVSIAESSLSGGASPRPSAQ